MVAHLLVREEVQQHNIRPKLLMNKEEYDSFDEIYERYIVPCNSVMEAAANHKKFSHENL